MKKPKKPSLRQELGQSKADLVANLSACELLRQNLRTIKFAAIPHSFGEPRFEDALEAIKILHAYKKENEGAINISLDYLRQENARLWHMIRSMTGDETLINSNKIDPTHLGGQFDPFNQPRF